MAFEAHQQQISFLLGKKVYCIPRNQRKYVWGADNWNNLLEDLDFLQGTGKYHFFGSIVLNTQPNQNNDDVEYFEIVDGQQRITTIILILIVIAQIFKERGEDALFQGLLPYIQTTNINNQTSSTLQTDVHSSIMNLVAHVADRTTPYNSMQLLITYCITNKKQDSIIEKCIKYYYNVLSARNTDEVASFRNALISSNYVNIKTTGEDAYTVFEILNARGMDLENHELLKNFILRYTVPINNVDIARQEWKDEIENRLGKNIANFLKHYVAHKYGIAGVTKNRAVYDAIKKHTSVAEVNRLFCDLKLKAKYYQQIVCENSIHDGQITEIDRILKFMLSNRSLLFRPVYLSLLHQTELGNISDEKLIKVFKCIQYFFVCYNLISKETSNKISEGIQKYAFLIENEYSDEVLKRFLQHLKDRMPTKKEFQNTFKLIGYSNHCEYYHDNKNKQRAEMALNILEQIKSGRVDVPLFTIEHILPDSQDRENAMIGNLIPLEENLNGLCKDKELHEKIPIYNRSYFSTARNISNRYGNNVANFKINSRSTIMADNLYDEISHILDAL
ncbi:DUF262 domain-containing protein [uncultured Bacteroides sp.]|uniref:DUF262 domain-containing protein n=1 Tax=uncultured Bacteroides sp. TaxID=162156 RepID=UPI002612D1F1|nr:DUF262 domain-containing protein [uncultured Bacteroides sp.]